MLMNGLKTTSISTLRYADSLLGFDQVVEVPNASWDDIGALENVKRELQEAFEGEKW